MIGVDSMTIFDEVFSPAPALSLSIFSEQWGGAALLDNFEASGIPNVLVVIGIPGGKEHECTELGGSFVDFVANVSPLPPGVLVTGIDWFLDGQSVGSGETINTFLRLGHRMIEVFVTTTGDSSSAAAFVDIIDTDRSGDRPIDNRPRR